jgi:hypothetical protein
LVSFTVKIKCIPTFRLSSLLFSHYPCGSSAKTELPFKDCRLMRQHSHSPHFENFCGQVLRLDSPIKLFASYAKRKSMIQSGIMLLSFYILFSLNQASTCLRILSTCSVFDRLGMFTSKACFGAVTPSPFFWRIKTLFAAFLFLNNVSGS